MKAVFLITLGLAVLTLAEEPSVSVNSPKVSEDNVWSASSLYGRTLAQATCAATSRTSGAAYAIRRECNAEAEDCHKVCAGVKDPIDKDATFSCDNSFHVSNGEGGDLPGEVGLRTFRYNSCRVKGCGPNYCCCVQKSKVQFLIRPTCKAILDAKESKGSGIYLVNPKGTADSAFEVYCDMTTDGGGWTLWAAYVHEKGQDLPLNADKIPTSLETGYSHQLLDQAGFIDEDVQELRFYCETSGHPRRMHFSTKNRQVELSALSDTGVLEADSFRRGSKALQGHTAFLPKSTASTGASSLFEETFFDSEGHMWSIRPEDRQFRCDDIAGEDTNTKHYIYFR